MPRKFNADVQSVVDALRNEEFSNIAIVAIKENGEFYMASSTSISETVELFNNAVGKIENGEFDD